MTGERPSPDEAERQLVAAADRHREAVTSMAQPGRPTAGQQAAVKAVARGVQLVAFALERAAAAGVPFERMVELTGWQPDVVRETLERGPEPDVVSRLAPAGLDPGDVAQAAASVAAAARIDALTARILEDLDDDAWSPASADLDDLYDRLETAWHTWRQALGRARPA